MSRKLKYFSPIAYEVKISLGEIKLAVVFGNN